MSFWSDARVRAALELPDTTSVHGLDYAAVSTDTRNMPADALFVALRGERFDGHEFIGQAVAAGAEGAVVERVPEGAPEITYYVVPDTLVALGMLARYYRRQLTGRVLAITGANGKTTTKELVRAVLACRFRTHATAGNLNNLVGAPQTLLAAPPDAEAIVVELGTNAPGEVARLAGIVAADACIVTGIAEEHLEGLGDLEGVLREETSLLPTLPKSGFAVVADDPPALAQRARSLGTRTLVAGWTERADDALRAEEVRIEANGHVAFRWQGRTVELGLSARHNARNALLALGVGMEWGVDPDAAAAALKGVRPGKLRGEIAHYGDLTVLVDCYNANPSSMLAAVDTLMALPGRARVAVIGTMLELGPRSAEIHRDVAHALAGSRLDLVIATGDFCDAFKPFVQAMDGRLVRVHDPLEAFQVLEARLRGDETVLIKGSHGVAMERLLPLIEKTWSASRPHGEAARPRVGSHHQPDEHGRPAGRAPGDTPGGSDEALRGGN